MPRGSKEKYTDKQKRKAEHIKEGYEERGVKSDDAARIAWATVNKESGGGNKSGAGRGVKDNHDSSRKGGKIAGKKRAKKATKKAVKKPAKKKSAGSKTKRKKAARN